MPAQTGYTVTARLAQVVLQTLAQHGQPAGTALRTAGLDARTLGEDRRLPVEQLERLLAACVEHSGDPAFGLLVARCYQPGPHVLEQILPHSADFGSLLEALVQYYALVNDALVASLRPTRGGTTLELRPREGVVASRTLLDLSLAVPVLAGGGILGAPLRTRIHFSHRAPADPAPYRAIFGPRLRWSSGFDGLFVPGHAMSRPIAQANPHLVTVLQQHAQQLAAAHDPEAGFAMRVRGVLLEGLPEHTDMPHVASQLGMSVRTLRRRLSEEDTHHSEVLDTLRRDLARDLLAQSVPLGDIAPSLGFASVGSLRRARVRWRD